jgi:hypothetical protein
MVVIESLLNETDISNQPELFAVFCLYTSGDGLV